MFRVGILKRGNQFFADAVFGKEWLVAIAVEGKIMGVAWIVETAAYVVVEIVAMGHSSVAIRENVYGHGFQGEPMPPGGACQVIGQDCGLRG
jgi:hypothetical protein